MIWFRELEKFDYLLICAFILFYGLYLYRIFRIGHHFKTPITSVFFKLLIRIIYFILLLVAFLGPSIGDSKREITSVGKDIMICVDLSKSMDAFDIQPSRLEKIKFELKKIVNAFNSDRIGIIIFSSEAFMQCPLTYDQNALDLFIETMNSSLVPATGTDFNPPMRMALRKLDEQSESRTAQKSKIILLISDGEDFGDDQSYITQEIEKQEIKVYTLGIGTENGSQIRDGSKFKTDKTGGSVITKLNVESLKKLASSTDGQYFEISDKTNDVARLINTLSKIEGEVRTARLIDASANRYYYFLLAGLILLILDMLVSMKTVWI